MADFFNPRFVDLIYLISPAWVVYYYLLRRSDGERLQRLGAGVLGLEDAELDLIYRGSPKLAARYRGLALEVTLSEAAVDGQWRQRYQPAFTVRRPTWWLVAVQTPAFLGLMAFLGGYATFHAHAVIGHQRYSVAEFSVGGIVMALLFMRMASDWQGAEYAAGDALRVPGNKTGALHFRALYPMRVLPDLSNGAIQDAVKACSRTIRSSRCGS